MQTKTYESKNTSFRTPGLLLLLFEDIREQRLMGRIITKCPIETLEFEEVDYWDELTQIMDWSKTVTSSPPYIRWVPRPALPPLWDSQVPVARKALAANII